MILWEYLRGRMLYFEDQEICEGDAHITFEELVVFAEEKAKELAGEKICAICCHSEMLAAMALLSCFAARVAAVPLSERYGDAHRKRILDACNPSCIITDTNGQLEVYHIADAACDGIKGNTALIMWTSGTTGKPKGAMLSEQNLFTNVVDIATYFAIDDKDTILIARPLYHCAVLTGEFLVSLVKGTRIIFSSEEFRPGPLLSLLREQAVTVFGGTPTLLRLLSRFDKQNNLGLRRIVISGECMSASVGRSVRKSFPNADIYHVYGLTEAGPRVSYLPPEHFDDAPDCVGIPLASEKIEIRDESENVLPQGENGILWVYGKNIMQGYYHAPKETRKILKNGWLNTGDLAVITDQGWLKILGRADDLIIRAGMNIYPQEIESELKKDTRTKEALAYGYREKDSTQIGLKISGDFVSIEKVRELCKAVLSPYQMPARIELLDELPKSGSGKVIRKHMIE